MKKVFSIFAFLLLFAAVTMAQPTNNAGSITPNDTIDVTLDNAMVNGVYDFTEFYGYIYFRSADSSFKYWLNLCVYTVQVAGSYTINDIDWEETDFKYDTLNISISEIRDFTIVGNADTCSTYLEIISSDSVLYRLTFVYPGVYRPVTPVDTVDIVMNSPKNYIYNGTANYGFFQLHGFDTDGEYMLCLGVNTDQIAGNYTRRDISPLYTFFYHIVGTDSSEIHLVDVHDFTMTCDSTTRSTYLELVSADSVLYRIDYVCTKRPSGVENTTETEFVVYNEGNVIVVNGAAGETMTVYDEAGKVIANKKALSDVERIEMPVPGIYVIRIGNQTFKALTK